MAYPGGKGGCFRHIINQIPPHSVYIETHLGHGGVMRNKRPADINIGVDADAEVITWWNRHRQRYQLETIHGDAVQFLRSYRFTGREVVYSDPPYLMETRKSGPLYRYEYTTRQHIELLETLISLPCYVLISGYHSSLYEAMLQGWNRIEFEAMTRQGLAVESLWMNYRPTGLLHDIRYAGSNFRERERIKRKQQRWRRMLLDMPVIERAAMLATIADVVPADMPKACTVTSGDRIPAAAAIAKDGEHRASPAVSMLPAITAGIVVGGERSRHGSPEIAMVDGE